MGVLPTTVSSLTYARKVIIENVRPEIDGGRFRIKRVIGEAVEVTADIFIDGHDLIRAKLLHRSASQESWTEVRMEPDVNDRWRGQFRVSREGLHYYTLVAWVDRFGTWKRDIDKKFAAGQDISVDALVGVELIEQAAARASASQARALREAAGRIRASLRRAPAEALQQAFEAPLEALVGENFDPRRTSRYSRELGIVVDRERARSSAWYEMFPRSCAPRAGIHGTFGDCMGRVDYAADMGFDVLYLPPIHPIGRVNRKGKNNAEAAVSGEWGSPWAIGSEEGGHKAIHPLLGTVADLKQLLLHAEERGMEVALDLAFQCAPDHPYVAEHPQWFRMRPDGTVQYAENPPKKYQDIYPLDFEGEQSEELWNELLSVVLYWVEQGIRIFRVDNPHTKPFHFWKWLIDEVKTVHPEVLFLAEAFTRPKVMYQLAKLGFTQSYSYFAWRNTKREITEYFTELTQTEVREYFRPNLWPNTPDILTEALQHGGRETAMARLVLAATLGANYGIYGPAFELGDNRAVRPGSEEYLDSEKYQLRQWNLDSPDSLKDLITRVNRIRKGNAALQSDWGLRFHPVDNEQLIVYSKTAGDESDILLMVVNLDPNYIQSGWVELPLAEFHLDPDQPYQVHDLLVEARYLWKGSRNYVELDPHRLPAHIFRIARRPDFKDGAPASPKTAMATPRMHDR